MTNIITEPNVYKFDGKAIRTLLLDGDPWFITSDVCAVLTLVNHRDAVSRLDDDEKGVALTDTPGGSQNLAIVSESGLYTLILRCRDAIKPGTVPHRFRRWVTSEVLPSIRKNGSYQRMPYAAYPVDKHVATGEAMRAAMQVAGKYFEDVRGMAIKGTLPPGMGRIPDEVLVGLVAHDLSCARFIVSYDVDTMDLRAKPIAHDAFVGDPNEWKSVKAVLRQLMPAHMIGDAMRTLSERVDIQSTELNDRNFARAGLAKMGVN